MNKVKEIFKKIITALAKGLKKLLELLTRFFKWLWVLLKKVFSVKRNIIIAAAILLLIIIFIIVRSSKKIKDKFLLDDIYQFYPQEVRNIYSNIVSVSCGGDLRFDVDVDAGIKEVDQLSTNNILDYLFSYLDKNNMLLDTLDDSVVKKTAKSLFNKKIDVLDLIKDYNYNGNIYNIKKGKLVSSKGTCEEVEKKHISHLYGFSYDEEGVYIDVNVAYLKDGKLYDYNDNELGEYAGDVSKLPKLMGETSYYRMHYIKDGTDYKLVSVEWKNRS